MSRFAHNTGVALIGAKTGEGGAVRSSHARNRPNNTQDVERMDVNTSTGYHLRGMSNKQSRIQQIEAQVAMERARDIARVRSGQISASKLGKENGAFGRAVAARGSIDMQRAVRSL